MSTKSETLFSVAKCASTRLASSNWRKNSRRDDRKLLKGDGEALSKGLTDVLAADQEERNDADATLRAQLHTLEETLDGKVAETDERVTSEVEKFHGVLAEGLQALTALLENTKEELSQGLNAATEKLDRDKLDSENLAQLFTDAARALKRDPK